MIFRVSVVLKMDCSLLDQVDYISLIDIFKKLEERGLSSWTHVLYFYMTSACKCRVLKIPGRNADEEHGWLAMPGWECASCSDWCGSVSCLHLCMNLSFAPSSQRRVRNADLKRAAFERTVTNMNTPANFCYIDCNRRVVHLDRDRISYHPWLQLIVMAGAYALQREAIPPEICAVIASTVVMVEKLAPEDVFTATFGTRLACWCIFEHV